MPRVTARRLAVGLPAALAAVLGVEIAVAATAEYLPNDPGYRIDVVVGSGASPPVQLAVLGDSTVAGVGSPTVTESLPVLVAERVAAASGRRVRVRGLGISGARTATVRTDQVPLLPAADDDDPLDVVVIVIGSNDTTHLTPVWDMDERTAALVDAAEQRTGAPVVVGGIPRFLATPALWHPLRELVDLYARPLRRAQRAGARASGASVVEIARDASPRFRGVPEAMSSDGFHPSPIGYGFWADAIAPVVVEALR